MDEKFICKWFSQWIFSDLKINEKGCGDGGAHYTLQRRVFSKNFITYSWNVQMYEPCERCYLDNTMACQKYIHKR